MEPLTFALLLVAGVGTGLVGYLTGLASIISYPALLAAGLPPVAANATNTVALVGVGVGATARASRLAFADRPRRTLQQLALALVGGGVGGGLLLLGGDDVFAVIVPWLIILGSVMLLASPRLTRLRGEGEYWRGYLVALFLVSIYCGYFGAGAGVLVLATTAILTSIPFQRAMVLKSLLLGVANIVASLIFIVSGVVNWWAAAAMGIGCLIGGSLGPPIQKLIPETVLRPVVAAAGFFMAVWLWVR
ncbi:MAG TPA: sulfite exporter TauE/SafE family protein [Actinomycetales bacterium]|nr:sulfite exporter TauE/SafE family protein [Actinomycetales bacterium]